MASTTPPFAPPVDQLLTLGTPRRSGTLGADYPALGFTHEHVPERTRMATDPALHEANGSVEVWAPLHALPALGQLRALTAVQPLVDLIARVDDDWVQDDVQQALGMIGGAAIARACELLANVDAEMTPRIRSEIHPSARVRSVSSQPRTREPRRPQRQREIARTAASKRAGGGWLSRVDQGALYSLAIGPSLVRWPNPE